MSPSWCPSRNCFVVFLQAQRFHDSSIYTSCGPVLIAVNPFQRLSIYSEDILSDYRANGLLRATEESGALEHLAQLPPHVFATADAAYRCMMDDDPSLGLVSRNQSVLVSGESGAGKTETTKLVLRYLSAIGRPKPVITGEHGPRPHLGSLSGVQSRAAHATAAASSGSGAELSAPGATITSNPAPAKRPSVEKAVLQSNPVLEALGNAKTTRNENSSRFGKFIVMQFSALGVLGGASVATYLLEKVRLVRQAPGERNYHIFYQMHAGLPDKTLTSLQLRGVDTHALTRESGTYDLRGIDDADVFGETVSAMGTMGLDESQQGRLWRVLAGLLHLGDLEYEADSGEAGRGGSGRGTGTATNEGSVLLASSVDAAKTAARLLGVLCDEGGLRQGADAIGMALTGKSIKVGMDRIRTLFTPAQARSATMSLIKDIYGKVFDWLVRRVNERIEVRGSHAELFIGVLDIFGFEHFEHNSFEQLCINFANERLQQHFNAFMFKLEQEEYQREGIDWSDIQFSDNQDCLDLIEGRRPPGILALVDEECSLIPKAPKAGDKRSEEEKSQELAAKLIAKLNETLAPKAAKGAAAEGHSRFLCTPKMRRDSCFVVRHYAGDVEYECVGFVEKNADQVHAEALALVRESTNPVVFDAYREAAEAEDEAEDKAAAAAATATSSSGGCRAGRRKTTGKETVGAQFKRQLAELMRVVRATTPHYIRCIKPNSDQVPVKLERPSVVSQLRCGGVLEAVRVARLGFPVRLPHHRLLLEYAALASVHEGDIEASEARAAVGVQGSGSRAIALRRLVARARSEDLAGAHDDEDGVYDQDLADAAAESAVHDLDTLRGESQALLGGLAVLEAGTFQVGRTKVFLRKSAFDSLQAALVRTNTANALTLQCAWRAAIARRRAVTRRSAVLVAQCAWRSFRARALATVLRRERASVCLSSFAKMLAARMAYVRSRRGATLLRAHFLRHRQRSWYLEDRRRRAATKLQAWRRSAVTRAWFLGQRDAAVSLQCFARMFASKARLELLKKEAREVGNLRETNVLLRQRTRALEGKLGGLMVWLAVQLGAKRIEWGRAALPGGEALSSLAQDGDEDVDGDDDGSRAAAMPSGFAVVMAAPEPAPASAPAAARVVDLARALRDAQASAAHGASITQQTAAVPVAEPSTAVPPRTRVAEPAIRDADAIRPVGMAADSERTRKLEEELDATRMVLDGLRTQLMQEQAARRARVSGGESQPDLATVPVVSFAIPSAAAPSNPAAATRREARETASGIAAEELKSLRAQLEVARRDAISKAEDVTAWQLRGLAAERRAAELEAREAGAAVTAASHSAGSVPDPARLAAEQRQEHKLRQAQSEAKATMKQLARVETELAGAFKRSREDRLAKSELARKLVDLQRELQTVQDDTVRMYQGELDKLSAECTKARDRYSRANAAALKMQEALRSAQARGTALAEENSRLKAAMDSMADDICSYKQQRAVDKRSKRMLIERADSALASQMATAEQLQGVELELERVQARETRSRRRAAALEELLRAQSVDPDAAPAPSVVSEATGASGLPLASPMVTATESSNGGASGAISGAGIARGSGRRLPSRLGAVAAAASSESNGSEGSVVTTPGGTKKRRKRNKKRSKNSAGAAAASAPTASRFAAAATAATADDESALSAFSGVFSSAFKAGMSLFASPTPAVGTNAARPGMTRRQPQRATK